MGKTLYHYFLVKRSNLFDKDYYLNKNPAIEQAKLNPIWHFLHEGW